MVIKYNIINDMRIKYVPVKSYENINSVCDYRQCNYGESVDDV